MRYTAEQSSNKSSERGVDRMDFRECIAREIEAALEVVFGERSLTAGEIAESIERPPDPALGDYAFPCFKLAKALRKAPPAIADALAAAIDADFLKEAQSVKGYLNFYLDRVTYAREVLGQIAALGARYGGSDEGAGKVVCIDYSAVNIAKRFHFGHLSTTMLGNALYKMYSFRSYRCVGINHLGDWGVQFGQLLAAYTRWGNSDDVERGGVDALTELYVRFNREAEGDPTLTDESREWFRRIEAGDAEAMSTFEWFKDITMREVEKTYELLGVTFDSYAGESFYEDKMAAVVDTLRETGLLVESQGAYIVDLGAYDMPPCLILKSDGATLYATRDLAAAIYRKSMYDFEKCLYVVAYHQDLHFRQVFKVLELMGYEWAKDCVHVAYGMVSYEGQSLSTRRGISLYLDDVLNKSVEKALQIIEEKSPELQSKAEVAKQVGVGAAVFFDLYNNRIKDIDFWWDRALNFDGETGPYVQYTHARACSVLRKANAREGIADYRALKGEESQNVVRMLERFPDVIGEAVERYEPSLVTRYAVDLCQMFNRFYREERILDDDASAREAKLELTAAVRQVIATALTLLGIAAPERM